MLEFGASFKKARESRAVSIDSIAKQTRISSRFLLAIENEQFELLPGGVFNRGFIRTYAISLGLDPEELIQAYEKLSSAVETEPVRRESDRVKGSTTKIPVHYVAIAGLLILVVVFYFATRHSELPQIATGTPPSGVSAARVEEVQAAQPVADVEPSLATTVAAAAELPAQPPVPIAAVSRAPVVFELEVLEDSWFKVSTDGTAVVMGEVLPAGTKRRYTAYNSMDVRIGNAAGVSIRVNGEAVSSLGRSGQVRQLTLTPKTTAASLVIR